MRPRALKILAHSGAGVLVREQVAGRLPPSVVTRADVQRNEDEEQDNKEAKTKEKSKEARGRRRSHML